MSEPIIHISQHAIERFIERSGCQNRKRAKNMIREIAAGAERIAFDKFESKGWTLVINPQGWVETIYRKGTVMNKSKLKKRVFAEN